MSTELAQKPGTELLTARELNRPQLEEAMICLAYNNGDTGATHRQLLERGYKIDPKTLWSWSRGEGDKADLYREVQREVLPKIRDQAAESHMQAADRTMKVEAEALQRLKGTLHEIPARDLPGAVRNLGTTTGIHRDKARDLRGESSLPSLNRKDLKEVLRSLQGKGLLPDAEVVDAEVVEEKPAAELKLAA